MRTLIGLVGEKYSGKDTAAIGLTGRHGFKKVAFAGGLKAMTAAYFRSKGNFQDTAVAMLDALFEYQGVNAYSRKELLGPDGLNEQTTYLLGKTPKHALGSLVAWGNTHIGGDHWDGLSDGPSMQELTITGCVEGSFKEHELSVLNGKSPRHVMQTLGTEWGRQCMHEAFWVTIAMRLAQAYPRCVVTDVRFDNEAELVRNVGGRVFQIVREGMPRTDVHASEKGVNPDLIDARIYNNSSTEELQKRLVGLTNAFMIEQQSQPQLI